MWVLARYTVAKQRFSFTDYFLERRVTAVQSVPTEGVGDVGSGLTYRPSNSKQALCFYHYAITPPVQWVFLSSPCG